jgi:hypothetical protein
MHESHAPDLVLRLSLPTAGDFARIAPEAAVKIAELLGQTGADARAAAETIEALIADVAPAGAAPATPSGGAAATGEITFEFHQSYGELRIEVHCAGRSSQGRHPLPT